MLGDGSVAHWDGTAWDAGRAALPGDRTVEIFGSNPVPITDAELDTYTPKAPFATGEYVLLRPWYWNGLAWNSGIGDAEDITAGAFSTQAEIPVDLETANDDSSGSGTPGKNVVRPNNPSAFTTGEYVVLPYPDTVRWDAAKGIWDFVTVPSKSQRVVAGDSHDITARIVGGKPFPTTKTELLALAPQTPFAPGDYILLTQMYWDGTAWREGVTP